MFAGHIRFIFGLMICDVFTKEIGTFEFNNGQWPVRMFLIDTEHNHSKNAAPWEKIERESNQGIAQNHEHKTVCLPVIFEDLFLTLERPPKHRIDTFIWLLRDELWQTNIQVEVHIKIPQGILVN